MQKSSRAIISAIALATSMYGAAAVAQTPPSSAQGAPTAQGANTPPVVKPSDAQLEKFAEAAQKVTVVADEYRPQLEAAKDDGARQEIFKQADQKMVQLVQADGLTVEEFNGISQAVQQDPELQQKVRAMVPASAGGTAQ